jgi:hypothetical protein
MGSTDMPPGHLAALHSQRLPLLRTGSAAGPPAPSSGPDDKGAHMTGSHASVAKCDEVPIAVLHQHTDKPGRL